VTLVDTSAWVEFLRRTGSPAHLELRALLEGDRQLATTEVVVMEVLAGARDPDHLQRLQRLLLRCRMLPVRGLADYEQAAAVYRACRGGGRTVRELADCLIATVAIRVGVPVLHADADFDVIARHSPLRVGLG
jgi:predicted nucleic acid-binding protein